MSKNQNSTTCTLSPNSTKKVMPKRKVKTFLKLSTIEYLKEDD